LFATNSGRLACRVDDVQRVFKDLGKWFDSGVEISRGRLTGVTVAAASPTSPTEYRVVSDKEGYYRLLDLPAGEYVMTAELTGFSKVVRLGVIVRAGLNLGIHLEMTVGAQNETVTVKADTPLLESRSSAQAVNVSGDLQRDVPLSGRKTWTDSLLLAPGVVSQELTNNIQWLFVHGADQNSNTFQIDGSDVASSVLSAPAYSISSEAIQDVAVKAARSMRRHLGLGAALGVTTKEGTSHVRGAVSGHSRQTLEQQQRSRRTSSTINCAARPRARRSVVRNRVVSDRIAGSTPHLAWAARPAKSRRCRRWFLGSSHSTCETPHTSRSGSRPSRLDPGIGSWRRISGTPTVQRARDRLPLRRVARFRVETAPSFVCSRPGTPRSSWKRPCRTTIAAV
jgi:hypothetical protein